MRSGAVACGMWHGLVVSGWVVVRPLHGVWCIRAPLYHSTAQSQGRSDAPTLARVGVRALVVSWTSVTCRVLYRSSIRNRRKATGAPRLAHCRRHSTPSTCAQTPCLPVAGVVEWLEWLEWTHPPHSTTHGCAEHSNCVLSVASLLERLSVEGEVVGHKRRDEVVGVVVSLLHAQNQVDALCFARILQPGRKQLVHLRYRGGGRTPMILEGGHWSTRGTEGLGEAGKSLAAWGDECWLAYPARN